MEIKETSRLFNMIAEDSDLYYLSLIILFLMKEKSEYGALSELTFLLDKDSFFNLLQYYEGETLKIPKREELLDVMRLILFYYYSEIKGMKWKKIFEKLNMNYDSQLSANISMRVKWLRKVLEDIEIPTDIKNMEGDV